MGDRRRSASATARKSAPPPIRWPFSWAAGAGVPFALVLSSDQIPTPQAIGAAWPLVAAIAWLAWLPSQFLLFWGVRRISPVRTGILLMTELVSGVATAAWLSGDPISWQQAVGGALISGGGIGRCADKP